MAFGKKKDDPLAAADAAGEIEPLFPSDDGSDEQDGADGEPSAAAEAAPESPPASADPAPVAAVAAEPADSLLSMFQAQADESADRSGVLDLVGDVDLADLLEELNTVAAAMGIRTAA